MSLDHQHDLADPAGPRTTGRDSVDLADLVAILLKRAWIISVICIACLGAALAYLSVATHYYRATTSIVIDPRVGGAFASELSARLAADQQIIESQIRLITATSVLARVVALENLADHPEFGPRPSLRQSLLARIGLGSDEPAERTASARTREQQVIAALAERIRVERAERSYVVDVEVAATDPVLAARLADAIAQAFIDDQIAVRAATSERETGFVQRKLAELETNLRDAERRVAEFRADNRIFSTSGRLVGDQQLEEAVAALGLARTRTADARVALERLDEIRRAGRLDAIGDFASSETIERLRTQYAEISRQFDDLAGTLGPNHPRFAEIARQRDGTQRLIRAELDNLVAARREAFLTAQAAERESLARVEALKGEAALTSAQLVRLAELEREVEAHRTVFQRFLTTSGSVAQESIETASARIASPAMVPLRPSEPKALIVLFIALAGGLFVGMALALAAHMVAMAKERAQAARGARPRSPEAGEGFDDGFAGAQPLRVAAFTSAGGGAARAARYSPETVHG